MIGPGSGSVKGKRCILLIDQDPSAGRRVALSLGGPQSEIFIAPDSAKGLALAASKKPDLILMETHFKDADGIEMAKKLLRTPGPRGVTIVFLTDDDSVAQRFRGIQVGAADYILKEVEGKALSARLAAILTSIGKPRPRPTVGPRSKQLLDQIKTLEQDAKNGTLSLQRPGQSASITFSFGEMQQAHCGSKKGAEALNEIAAHENWTATYTEGVGDTHDSSEITAPEHAQPPTTERGGDVWETHDRSEITAPEYSHPLKMERGGVVRNSDVTEPSLPAISEELVEASVSPLLDRLFEDSGGENISLLDPEENFSTDEHLPLEREEDTDRTAFDPLGPSIVPSIKFEGRNDPTPTAIPSRKKDGASPSATIKKEDTAEGLKELPSLLDIESSDSHDPLENTFKEGEDTPTTTFPVRESLFPEQPPSMTEGATSRRESSAGEMEIAQWLSSLSYPCLLLAMPKGNVRDELRAAVEPFGFSVIFASTGLEAYTSALKKRPQVIISDTHGVKVDGREILTAVRSDFLIRETAFLMVSVEHLAEQIKAGVEQALDPILRGLEAALAAKAHFYTRLKQPDFLISGRVEPIGIAHLLREIWRARLSGRLSLKTQGLCQAEVLIVQGNISSVTIDEGQIVMGPMAFLHLLGYEWQEYSFTKDTAKKQRVISDTHQVVEVACELNNLLLYKIYQKGISSEDVSIEKKTLDAYLQTLPFGTLKVLIRLVEGEKAVSLAEAGISTPGILKSFLHDFRRKGVFRLVTLDLIATELTRLNKFAAPKEKSPHSAGRRWWVAVFTTIITIALAVGGYWGYQHYLRPSPAGFPTDKPAPSTQPINGPTSEEAGAPTQPAGSEADRPAPSTQPVNGSTSAGQGEPPPPVKVPGNSSETS